MSDRISSWSCDHPKLCNDRSYDVSKIINSKKFEKSEPNGMTATVVKMTILERSLILRRKDQRKNTFPVYSHVRPGLQVFMRSHVILFDVPEQFNSVN